MYCFLIETTGQSWHQVRHEWNLPRLDAWVRYCQTHPTLRLMVQQYLGIKTEAAAPQSGALPSGAPQCDILDMLATFPGAVRK